VEAAKPHSPEEHEMHDSVVPAQSANSTTIPRGWIILGATVTSWALVLTVGAGATQLFGYVASAL
jgi:hypothetical protein